MTATQGRGARATGRLALLSLGGVVAYGALIRPWHLRWGATPEEATSVLPGDGLVPSPTVVSTRAVTIDAPPGDVWPWLVQLGRGRGGLYSHDWLENLFGLGIHSVDRVVPELQGLEVGDHVDLSDRFFLVVRSIERERALALELALGGWSWTFDLAPSDDGGTRLLVRNRWSSHHGGLGWRVSFWAMEPAAFVMEHRMLQGLRRRAEGRART